jgi:hypothetical protein
MFPSRFARSEQVRMHKEQWIRAIFIALGVLILCT